MVDELNIELTIRFLRKEPKIASKFMQKVFMVTRPIAEFLDGFLLIKNMRIDKRRRAIAIMNKWDFIETVGDALFDEVLTHGTPFNIDYCRLLCLRKAEEMFYEKKMSNEFDDLNIMI